MHALTATGSTAALIVPNNKAEGILRLDDMRLAAESPNKLKPIRNYK